MRVLLDENLPRALAAELTGHEVSTVQAAGWSGTTNGELLRRAQGRFDALLSMDRGLQHQQDPSALHLRIVVIRAPSNRMVVALFRARRDVGATLVVALFVCRNNAEQQNSA